MKYVALFFLSFFLLVFLLGFLLQTPLVKNEVKKALVCAAKEKGIDLHIDKLEGNLPFEWNLKGVTFNWNEHRVSVQTVKCRFAILPLFSKYIEVSHFKMIKGRMDNIPFEGKGKGWFCLQDKTMQISHFTMEGKELFLRFEGKLQRDFSIERGHLAFQLPNLSLFDPSISSGSATGNAQIAQEAFHIECQSKNLKIKNILLEPTTFIADAKKTHGWEGEGKISSGHLDIPLNGRFQFHLDPKFHSFSLSHFQIEGPELSFVGKLDYDIQLKCFQGNTIAAFHNLKTLRSLFPDSYLKGKIKAKIDFQNPLQSQDIKCQIHVENFAFFDATCENLTFESNFYDLFRNFHGDVFIACQKISLPHIELDAITFKSTCKAHASPFELSVTGTWKDPFKLAGSGSWQKRNNGFFFNIDATNGFAFQRAFSLCEPFSLEWNTDHFKMSNFSLDIGEGHLTSRIDLAKNTSLIKLKAEDFPLEFFALPHKHFSLGGMASFEIDLVSWENNIQGNCNVALKRAHFLSGGGQDPITTKGSLQIHLSDNKAQIHGELKAIEDELLLFSGTLPILYQHFPFQIRIDAEKPLSGQIVAEGKLEDLLKFVNIGHHRIEGWLGAKIYISQTLKQPIFQGKIEIEDGLFENYNTGTHLEQISLKATANKQSIYITELEGTDGREGKIHATGNLLFSASKHFPFILNAQLDSFEIVSFDTLTGNCSGNLIVTGDDLRSVAKGNLKVDKATFLIPDALPSALPKLPITFIHPPEKILRKKVRSPSPSPLQLDLDLEVPRKAFIEGRGMHAELQGKLRVTGTYTDIRANGKLQLLAGEYLFSGKVFDLSEGEILFYDRPTPSAYISLSGNCDLPDVNVTAILRGPLSSPKLSFQSSPQLPISSLLSQILFNKDISEISAIQALQLAQTVISLSGNTGPDILEKIRKTLGIDRLTLVTSENDPGKISLQLGKYLMRGVLLTLSQGAESRNVSVEVDLKKGIRFEAEVNEDQQGKFSLKWHHHY